MINSVSGTAAGSYGAPRSDSPRQDTTFAMILQDKTDKKMSAKDYLRTLTAQELGVLQAEQRLAAAININELSTEGAENLFVARDDKKRYQDLNNDGLVEIGAGKIFVFPPVNAPEAVKAAWDKTVAGMTLGERMRAEAPFLVAQLKANIRSTPDGRCRVVAPGEEGYRNAFGDSAAFYRGMLNSLKAEKEKELGTASGDARQNIKFTLKVIEQFLGNLAI